MKKATPITIPSLEGYAETYYADPKNLLLTHAYAKVGMGDLAFDPVAARKMQFKFSVDIPTMSATNQRASGRCWLFAATNVLREIIAKKK
ncbi:MAG: hypothetical protein J6R82_03005, partial [Clostridia bacterium]|nr:hypothetical protein [Clostridia bacterium]